MKVPARFLTIDDDPLTNRLCSMAIAKAFETPNVLTFTEPETAIEFLEQEGSESRVHTVLFLDINMPSLTGWEVLDILKNSQDNLRDKLTIFVLSSSISPADKQKAQENPLVTGYLEKPLTSERLQTIFGN